MGRGLGGVSALLYWTYRTSIGGDLTSNSIWCWEQKQAGFASLMVATVSCILGHGGAWRKLLYIYPSNPKVLGINLCIVHQRDMVEFPMTPRYRTATTRGRFAASTSLLWYRPRFFRIYWLLLYLDLVSWALGTVACRSRSSSTPTDHAHAIASMNVNAEQRVLEREAHFPDRGAPRRSTSISVCMFSLNASTVLT